MYEERTQGQGLRLYFRQHTLTLCHSGTPHGIVLHAAYIRIMKAQLLLHRLCRCALRHKAGRIRRHSCGKDERRRSRSQLGCVATQLRKDTTLCMPRERRGVRGDEQPRIDCGALSRRLLRLLPRHLRIPCRRNQWGKSAAVGRADRQPTQTEAARRERRKICLHTALRHGCHPIAMDGGIRLHRRTAEPQIGGQCAPLSIRLRAHRPEECRLQLCPRQCCGELVLRRHGKPRRQRKTERQVRPSERTQCCASSSGKGSGICSVTGTRCSRRCCDRPRMIPLLRCSEVDEPQPLRRHADAHRLARAQTKTIDAKHSAHPSFPSAHGRSSPASSAHHPIHPYHAADLRRRQ